MRSAASSTSRSPGASARRPGRQPCATSQVVLNARPLVITSRVTRSLTRSGSFRYPPERKRPGVAFSTCTATKSSRGMQSPSERMRYSVDEATTLHWHGMHLPPSMDGGPHQPIAPGTTWSPSWTVDQPAATLWFHPHLHGATAEHVYRGAAGMFIVDDPDSLSPLAGFVVLFGWVGALLATAAIVLERRDV